MNKLLCFLTLIALLISGEPLLGCIWVKPAPTYTAAETQKNPIPARYQWDANAGYCGEVSFISAGLYYGQYVSQYDARSIACKGALQNKSQLLLGKNDAYAAKQMHLNAIIWDTDSEQTTDQFLAWVKQNVVKGYPVIIGIFTNEYLFYTDTDPDAGDSEYDHIVPVIGFGSNHPLADPAYYGDDTLFFSDNGLWGSTTNPPYYFNYYCDPFQADRKLANSKHGSIYSVNNDAANYGIAITGVADLNNDTMPVRLTTNVNNEVPPIEDKSSTRPPPMPITLTITVSGLDPNTSYNLYRYNSFDAVPDSEFNAHASNASEHWNIAISSGTTFVMTEQIQSNEMAIYRAVRADAP